MPYRRACLISGCALVKLHCMLIWDLSVWSKLNGGFFFSIAFLTSFGNSPFEEELWDCKGQISDNLDDSVLRNAISKMWYKLCSHPVRHAYCWAKWARWDTIIQPDNQLYSLPCFLACSNQNINLFILLKFREKEQAKWAKWARILKNTLTDEQLCSLLCFLVLAYLKMYEYFYSFIAFEIRKKRLSWVS